MWLIKFSLHVAKFVHLPLAGQLPSQAVPEWWHGNTTSIRRWDSLEMTHTVSAKSYARQRKHLSVSVNKRTRASQLTAAALIANSSFVLWIQRKSARLVKIFVKTFCHAAVSVFLASTKITMQHRPVFAHYVIFLGPWSLDSKQNNECF